MQTTRGTSLTESDSPVEAAPPPTRASTRRVALLGAVAVFVIVADLLSKLAVVAHMTMYESHDVLGGLLKITYTRNPGAAFSVGEGMTAVFGLVAIAVAVAIVRTARSLRSLTWAITLGLLLGGALGNLGDRVFRSPGFLRGHVVDWIQVPALAGVQPGRLGDLLRRRPGGRALLARHRGGRVAREAAPAARARRRSPRA